MKTTSILYCMLLLIAVSLFTTPAKAQVNVNDSLALVDLYNSTDGPEWTYNYNWLTKKPVSSWYGVTVTDNRVTTIYLSYNQLSGSIPSSIGNLVNLTNLYLYNNQLSGSIPSSIGNLTNLEYLDLYYNKLSGSIPSSIGNLVSLTYLDLSHSQLSGAIPVEIGKLVNLTDLRLYNNQLNGSIPASIGNLTNIDGLRLQDNRLSGIIPAEIGNLRKLEFLTLSNNQLSEAIPAEIGKLVNLQYLYLNNNQLSGAIPAEIGNLVKLGILDLHNNQFSGSIPETIGNFARLEELYLNINQLSGAIPAEIGKLKTLYGLNLSNNQLSGSIPAAIGNLVRLTGLYLDSNQLSGSIPANLGKIKYLYELDLSHNQLSGSIPANIGKFKNLQKLNLSHNQLSGTIPISLGIQKFFTTHINLSFNQLSQYGNVDSHKKQPRRNVSGYINNNFFTFDGLEFIAENYPNATYAPQANIPIRQHGNTLSVYAGGTLSNNTYRWHQVGTEGSTVVKGDSTFTPSQSGKYHVTVTNKIAVQLKLCSDTIDFTLSPLKQSSNTIITKAIQPATIIQHMLVYPNPAKDVMHVQVKGTATIVIADANGKILLSKSINNSEIVNVSALAPGTYYLQNKTTGEVQKIVVVH